MTIGICKAIPFTLMIFYTQYCPITAFICDRSLRVLFRSRRFHLQTSKMMLFVIITVAKVVFCWTMVLVAQFLLMKFLFFVSIRCRVHLVTGDSNLFQVVLGSSCLFQVVPACLRWFQVVSGSSSLFQVVPAHFLF